MTSTAIKTKIKIIIIDDHYLVRESWKTTLNNYPLFVVTGLFSNAEEAIEKVKVLMPDIVIMDINLPGISGVEATKIFKAIMPAVKILGVSMHQSPLFARKMISMGAMGYVTKSSSPDEMYQAITEIHKGNRFICNEVKDIIANQLMEGQASERKLHSLSQREIEITKYITDGMSSKEIAGKLNLSVKTIDTHRYHILKKFNVNNTARLINYVHENPMLLDSLN